jgi:DNA (cytosine-5)-methyltransferase 1
VTSELYATGLFAGIGGIERGFERAGIETAALCEIDEAAFSVLSSRFADTKLFRDVRTMRRLPKSNVLTAGFPCQDLSQAGRKAGIAGTQSSLVSEVFRLCEAGRHRPRWVVLENVSYMLKLGRGKAMTSLVQSFEDLGYRWAYRVVDARAFGIPQRRQRVLFVASLKDDPRSVLFADEASANTIDDNVGAVDRSATYGFYWTEGLRGLGWAKNAVPTIKGGSKLGIPSPPAIWLPKTGVFGTPTIEDAERLQGFPINWTLPASMFGPRAGARWRLVGNAVCVPMAEWLGRRLMSPGECTRQESRLAPGHRWPNAAWGSRGDWFSVDVTMFPRTPETNLQGFMRRPLRPLSLKAARGFLSRAERGSLRFADGFLDDLRRYIASDSVDPLAAIN